jgi:hypothetical protein
LVRERGFSVRALEKGWDPHVLTYAITDMECVKIGKCSGHPMARLRELQVGSSRELRLLAYTATLTEAQAHRRLGRHRVLNEWFETAAVLEMVKDFDWLNVALYRELRAACALSS